MKVTVLETAARLTHMRIETEKEAGSKSQNF